MLLAGSGRVYPGICLPTLYTPGYTLGIPPTLYTPSTHTRRCACVCAGALGSDRPKALGRETLLRFLAQKCDVSYGIRALIIPSFYDGMDKDWIATGPSCTRGA